MMHAQILLSHFYKQAAALAGTFCLMKTQCLSFVVHQLCKGTSCSFLQLMYSAYKFIQSEDYRVSNI